MWSSADENATLAHYGAYNDGTKPVAKTLTRADHERLAQQRLYGAAIKLARAAEQGCCYRSGVAPDYIAAAVQAKRLTKLATLCAEAAAGEHTWLMAEAFWCEFSGEKPPQNVPPPELPVLRQIPVADRVVPIEKDVA